MTIETVTVRLDETDDEVDIESFDEAMDNIRMFSSLQFTMHIERAARIRQVTFRCSPSQASALINFINAFTPYNAE